MRKLPNPLFKKPEPTNIRGICVVCNKNKQKAKPGGKFRARCNSCERKHYNTRRNDKRDIYRKFVGDSCVRCGFVPEHICQLDVDHIDGNHHNHEPDNLQTLCANCHRLKTFKFGDWSKKPIDSENNVNV